MAAARPLVTHTNKSMIIVLALSKPVPTNYHDERLLAYQVVAMTTPNCIDIAMGLFYCDVKRAFGLQLQHDEQLVTYPKS